MGATLDALPLQLAVLDGDWDFHHTNRAWRQFSADNGRATGSPGEKYLAVCDESAEDEGAAAVAEGLRAVIDGERDHFAHEYPLYAPDEREAVLDAGYTTAADGTGFGLAIVERVASVHGWTLKVTGSASCGARFGVGGLAVRADAASE